LSVVSIFVALLAGKGVDHLMFAKERLSRKESLLTDLCLVSALVAALVVFDVSALHFHFDSWLRFARKNLVWELTASSLFVLLSLIIYSMGRRLPRSVIYPMIVIILAADLWYFNLRQLVFDTSAGEQLALPADVVADPQHRFIGIMTGSQILSDTVRYSRFVPVAIKDRFAMVGTNEGGVLPSGCETIFRALETNSKQALALVGCKYLAVHSQTDTWESLPRSVPRIRFHANSKISDLATSISEISPAVVESYARVGATNVQLQLNQPNAIDLKVICESSGVLVIADTIYPGWMCHVDGAPCQIHRVHGALRGIELQKGEHDVQLRFSSTSCFYGLLLSLFGITAWAPFAFFNLLKSVATRLNRPLSTS
jgi:hypothetical protein